MIKQIEIGNAIFHKAIRNEVLTRQLHSKFLDAHNHQHAYFPYGPAPSDYRYAMGKRFNPIVSEMNKLVRLPWAVGPCVDIFKIRERAFSINVDPRYCSTFGLPYKTSVASMNEYFHSKHVMDLERHYVFSKTHNVVPF